MSTPVAPGDFVDIHCHGGGGYYFSDPDPANIQKAIDAHKAHGTGTLLASLVTAPISQIKAQIERLIPFAESGEIAGIHLEGPYLAHARCGAHDPDLLRNPAGDEVRDLIATGRGHIKMITIAPELEGALSAISFMSHNGVIAAIGHSAGTYEDAKAGIEAGATVVTHFSNGMAKLKDGDHTFATAVLEDPRVALELIVDGHHVPLDVVKDVFTRAPGRVILITDAMSAAALSDGDYKIGELDVEVRDAVARLKSNGSLAGSTLTMDVAVATARAAGVSEEELLYSSSTLPARLLRR